MLYGSCKDFDFSRTKNKAHKVFLHTDEDNRLKVVNLNIKSEARYR